MLRPPLRHSKIKLLKHMLGFLSTIMLALSFAIPSAAAQELNRTALPIPQGPLKGHVTPRTKDSAKDFPVEVSAPKGALNVLVIITDDVGYGAPSSLIGPTKRDRLKVAFELR